MIDPDKVVDKNQEEHPSIYQSKKQPLHYESEGGEFLGENSGKKRSKQEAPPEEIKKAKIITDI